MNVEATCAESLAERPPSKIDGKTNPDYQKWWLSKRGTTSAEFQKEWRRNNPDKYRAAHDRSEAIKAKRHHELNKRTHTDECKCVECGMIFKRDDALLKGFKFMGSHRGICGECAKADR